MSKARRLSIPFCARRKEARDDQLVGTESLEFLSMMHSFDKDEQYLFFYNYLNERIVRHNGRYHQPHYIKSPKRAPQTTFVLDFDGLTESVLPKIEAGFERLRNELHGKCLLLTSPSGNRHVMFTLSGVWTEEFYIRVQELVIKNFFKDVEMLVDRPSSMSLNRGFYHSQHVIGWIQRGLVNITPAAQEKKGLFWKREFAVSFVEIEEILHKLQPLAERKGFELASDAGVMLKYIQHIARGNNEDEKARYSERLFRILAELESRNQEKCTKYAEEICTRAQTEQYQAASVCIKGFISETILRTQTISPIYRKVAEALLGTRIAVDQGSDAAAPTSSGESSVQGNDGPCDGCSDSSDGGNDRTERSGRGDDRSDERILGHLSSFWADLESRAVTHKNLGECLSSCALRVYSDGDTVSEKPDLERLVCVMREILVRNLGIQGHGHSVDISCWLWLRHARSYLRTKKLLTRSLSESTADAARCFRLHLKTQNVKINPQFSQFSRLCEVKEDVASSLLTEIEKNLESYMEDLTLQNKQTVRKMFREDRQFLISGASAFLTFLKQSYPLIKKSEPVAVGLEDFQIFFQTHSRKATALRKVFMRYFGQIAHEYTPCLRRREFVIDRAVLGKLFVREDTTPKSVVDLIMIIGRGRTWNAIKRHTKPMVKKLGLSRTRSLWYDALERSTANDIERRKKDIDRFLAKIEGFKHADSIIGRPNNNTDHK